jgi:hypothetical protein
MDNKSLIKAGIMFGGGFLLFMALKPSANAAAATAAAAKSFDSTAVPAPTSENAEVVMIAYTDALNAGEPPSQLTELNKEMMKEFGMRCYVDGKTNKVVVCDVKGETVLEK